MKALVITNKVRKIPNGFVEAILNPLLENQYEVIWAANFSELKVPKADIPCSILDTDSQSHPFSLGAIKTYKKICRFLKENKVDLIFCSTPIGGLLGRLCGKKFKIKTVIYQCHGFLFFKGGPKLGFAYKMLERLLAHYTDALITINNEDFIAAKKFKLKNKSKNVFLVNGSGADYTNKKLSDEEKDNLRNSLNLQKNDFVFISVGELNKNKNVIKTVKAFKKANLGINCKLLICGEGYQSKQINRFINKTKIKNNVFLLGYRNDVKDLFQISNCYISTSFREGLSRTVGEALGSGLPCIVSNKRGLSDWIEEGCGFVVDPKNVNSISNAMIEIFNNKNENFYIEYGIRKISSYSSNYVSSQMKEIFRKVLPKEQV